MYVAQLDTRLIADAEHQTYKSLTHNDTPEPTEMTSRRLSRQEIR